MDTLIHNLLWSIIPLWVSYFLHFEDNLQIFQGRRIKLEDRLNDIRMRVEDQQFQTGRRRKEVDIWLNDTGAKCAELRMLHNMTYGDVSPFQKITERLRSGGLIKRLIKKGG